MSFLEKAAASFNKSLSSAASKISVPRPAAVPTTLTPASPSPSIGSTTSRNDAAATPSGVAAAAGGNKRKRDTAAVIYSQPEITGYGTDINTQLTFAVEYLKKKDDPKTATDVLDHLSLHNAPQAHKQQLVEQMRRHPRIQWHPDENLAEQTWRSGAYSHRALIPNVRSKEALLAHLRQRGDAYPVSVKELKDGWPDCEPALADLEREHRLLVLRNKKDGQARLLWLDDPSLAREVDGEFRLHWHRIKLPSRDDIVRRLVDVGQKPASEDPAIKAAAAGKVDKKKKRVQKRNGRRTNTHLEHLLKDW